MFLDKMIKKGKKMINFKKWNLIFFLILILSCDETPPYVQIISPVEGAVMPSNISIIQAEAYDNDGDGKVVSVDFYIDGILIGTANNPNSEGLWEYPWNVSYWADSSDHSITAKALDYSNNIGQSNIVTVMVPSGIEILPTLLEPEFEDIINYTNRPTFSWFGLQSTSNYEIEISIFNDIDDFSNYENYIEEHIEFSNSIIDTTITDTFFTVPFALANETSAFYWHIRGENELGNMSDWSDTWVFKITGPDPPLLSYPIQETVYSLPTFTWLNSPSAYKYNIVVSKADICEGEGDLDNCFINLAFADTIDRDLGQIQEYISDAQVTLMQGEHWWKVRSKNQNEIWGDWSEAKSFEILPPNPPTLTLPYNGEKITYTDQPQLNWEFNDGSVLYQVQISKTNGSQFEDSIYVDNDSLYTNLFDLENSEFNLFEGNNYWRVKAANNTNAWSEWSEIFQFRITGSLPPIIIDPQADAIFTQDDVLIFNWEPSLDADTIPAQKYQIQINYNESDEFIMKDVLINGEDLTFEFYEISSFLFDQSYYRIRAQNHLDFWGDWSSCDLNDLNEAYNCNSIKDYVRFYYTPEAPELGYPVSTSQNEIQLLTQPTFSWGSVLHADEYNIELSNNQSFDSLNLIFDVITSDIEFNISLEEYNFESFNPTTLYWRVQSIVNTYNNDLLSVWSDTKEFSAIRPQAPELEYPNNGEVINENLQFEWSDVEGAQKYQIIVSDNFNFNNNGTIINTISSGSYLYSFDFINNVQEGNYYWKVRTQSELGIWSEFSEHNFFEVISPPKPELYSPIDLSSLIELDSLIWMSPIDLSQYQIEITNQKTGEIFSDYTTSTNYTNLSYALDEGTHYWRIRSQNNMGMWSDWTEPWYFWLPYDLEEIMFDDYDDISFSYSPITTEQYVDFLNEAYHDSLEYIVTRNQYIKGYCEGMPEGEEYNFIKKATPSDISSYNLARVRWNADNELFYFEGSNDLIYDNHPMIFVTWCGAMAFAKHYNFDLPSIEEWQNAISQSGWNNNVEETYLNYLGSGDPWDEPGGTTPVNFYQYPLSNLNDALGNVWEWTKNDDDSETSDRSCVGGSYLYPFEEISIESVLEIENGTLLVNKDVGFRVVKR